MNIKEAKKQVRYTVQAYLAKDRFGEYRIPSNRQRPLFLVGPPGIGKTDIMAQVASEMGIALVAYSMTHHTRQSALGLPYIKEQEYGGETYRTTEYTMSEIIASVYDAMEATGREEGILFLDEINCISETLAPSMLQFLQTKTFGKHRVPKGWVILTAGNPPEYNNSVREFDLATMDRLKAIDVEPEFEPWKEYAENEGVHAAILAYLEVHPKDFYSVTTSIDGTRFVTARGWTDLSEMIHLYEEHKFDVDLELISQYVKDERIARDFSAFYDLFFKYQEEYHIVDILRGETFPGVIEKASKARFDENIVVIKQFFEALVSEFEDLYEESRGLARLMTIIKNNKEALSGDSKKALETLIKIEKDELKRTEMAKKNGTLKYSELSSALCGDLHLKELIKFISVNENDAETAEELILNYIAPVQKRMKEEVRNTGEHLKNVFDFIKNAYNGDKEMLLFVTHLSKNRYSADFIMNYGSKEYLENSKLMKLEERELELINMANELGV